MLKIVRTVCNWFIQSCKKLGYYYPCASRRHRRYDVNVCYTSDTVQKRTMFEQVFSTASRNFLIVHFRMIQTFDAAEFHFEIYLKTERQNVMLFDKELARFSFAIQLPTVYAKINLSCRLPVPSCSTDGRVSSMQ